MGTPLAIAWLLLIRTPLALCSDAGLTVGALSVWLDGGAFQMAHERMGVFLEGTLGDQGAMENARPEVVEDQGSLSVTDAMGNQYAFRISPEQDTRASITLNTVGPGPRVTVTRRCWGPDPLPCRLEAGDQAHVVHTQVGVQDDPRFDSLFDRASDCALTVRYRVDEQTPLVATVTRDFMKQHRGIRYYAPIDKTAFPAPPCGWCSWYYYYRGLNETEALKNLDWMAQNLVPFGATYFQIDDIWQGQGDAGSEWWRDWNSEYTELFPHGMKWLAGEVRRRGMKPGIWLACFGQSDSAFVRAHPELWLVDDKGQYVDGGWVGRYLCDPSGEAGRQYLGDLFRRLALDWGFDYFKIDGQPSVIGLLREHQRSLKSPEIPADEAYRAGLRAIREAIGPERFLLGCWGIPLEGVGIMNGSRTGGDVGADWRGFQPALDCTMRWYFTHNTVWYADPDTLLVRPPLTLDQARVWASLYGLTGQLLMASDCMYQLPPDRVEVLKRVFPPADIAPVCLYPYEGRPRIWHLTAQVPGLQRDVVGLFNWDEQPAPIRLRFAEVLSGCAEQDPVAVYDFWEHRYLGRFQGSLTVTQRPTSCNVLSLARLSDRPQLISTSRHITQGAVEVTGAHWLVEEAAWVGASQCVAGDPYTLSFLLDTAGAQTWEVAAASSSIGPVVTQTSWPLARVSFTAPQSSQVSWRVQFRPAPRPAEQLLGVVRGLQASSNHWRRISLAWEPVEGASAYLLTRNGQAMGLVLGTSFLDGNLEPATEYTYSVRACGVQGKVGPVAAAITARTLEAPRRPPRPQVYLTDLTPVSVREGWGKTHFDRSVEGNPLRIGQETFERGIGTHASAELVYDIAGRAFREFVALVGIDREITAPLGSCAFQVYVDGVLRYDSEVRRVEDEPLGVRVDVSGARELKLIVTDGGDNIHYDHADWAEAGFLR